jgi:cell division protein FtsL
MPLATIERTLRDSSRHKPWQEFSSPLALTVAAVTVGLAALLALMQSSDATTTSARVQRLQDQLADWEARTQELQVEVATLGGLERIEREATERLKMVPATETIYVTVDEPGPEPARLPSRFLPPSQARPTPGGDTLWDKIFGWLPWP